MFEALSNDWVTKPLVELGSYINGYAFKPDDWKPQGLPIVRIAQITGSSQECDYYEGTISEAFKINSGDLIFSWSGTLAVIEWQGGPAWLNQHLFKVVPAKGISRRFLFHVLKSSVEEMDKRAHGSTMKHIKRGELKEFLVNVPVDADEQEDIANILDTLDTQIRQTEAIIAKLQQVKQGLLHDLLTRGIDANGQLRPPRDQAPELYKESPLGWIPREWEVSELQNLAEVVDPQPDHRTPPESKEGVPYVGIGDVDLNGNIDTSKCRRVIAKAFEKQRARFKVRSGDIIFGKIGTIGQPKRLCSGDYAISANVVLIQPKISERYIYSVSESEYFETQILDITNTTSQPALGIQQVRKLLIPVPMPPEVSEIGERMRFHSDRLTSEVGLLKKLKKQKSGLMDDLLTGRIRVTSLLETAKAS